MRKNRLRKGAGFPLAISAVLWFNNIQPPKAVFLTGISAVGSVGGLGAIFRLSTMGTAKARNPLQHERLRDFSRQQNWVKNRFDHINDYRQEKL